MKIGPRLGRADVMLNSFSSCISNAPEELSRAPEMPFSEIIPQPRMFLHQLESTIPFEKLQCLADRHCGWDFDKQMDMVNCNMQLVNFTSMFESSLSDKPLTINPNPIKLEWVHSVLAFPHEVECILPEGMLKTLQIHFFPPKPAQESKAHANFFNLVSGAQQSLSYTNRVQELNVVEKGNSSLGLKAEVPLPLM